MRVLLLADIHANSPALQAVLAASKKFHCDETWCLGDIVGYGPFPNAAARLLKACGARAISGNPRRATRRRGKCGAARLALAQGCGWPSG